MPVDKEYLNPAAKLLVQKYMLAVVAVYGTIAVAVLAIIGSFVASSIDAQATETARKAAAREIERHQSEFAQLSETFDREMTNAHERVSAAEARVVLVSESAAEGKGRALASIHDSELAAERAYLKAKQHADETIAQSVEVHRQINAIIESIGDKAPEVAEQLREYTRELVQLSREVERLKKHHTTEQDANVLRNIHFFAAEDVVTLWDTKEKGNASGVIKLDIADYGNITIPDTARGVLVKVTLKTSDTKYGASVLFADHNGKFPTLGHFHGNGFSNASNDYVGGTIVAPFHHGKQLWCRLGPATPVNAEKIESYGVLIGYYD